MKIIYFTLIESIIFLTLAYFLGKKIKNITDGNFFLILNYAFWIILIILSILINFKKYLYFLSVFVITIIVSIIILLKVDLKKYFKDKLYFSVYILSGITFIALFNFLISKYFIYNMLNTEAPQGIKGQSGVVGNNGKSFFIETLPEKCYQELINHIENKYGEIKKSNDIPFNIKDYHINNMFIKDNIKRICYSNEFLDNFYIIKQNNKSVSPECVMKYDSQNNMIGRYCNVSNKYGNIEKCNNDKDCMNIEDSELKFKRIVNELKQAIAGEKNSWLELILKNNCEQDIQLRDKLGGARYETLDELYPNSYEDYDKNLRHNNKVGHDFLEDNFQNDKYWDKHLNKKINNNPFDTIKQLKFKDDPNKQFWNWGIPIKKCVK